MTAEGTLITIGEQPALRFERRYPRPIERVWRALTEPDEMAEWFPSNVVGERAVGAPLVFDDDRQRAEDIAKGEPTRAEGPAFRGTVLVHDPPNVFSFTWGGEVLRFELTADGDDTVLVFTQVLTHPSVAARNGAGWHACLIGLDQLLGASPSGDTSDWEAVYDGYLDRLGPALGVSADDGSMTWERATHVEADRVRVATTDPAELAAWGAGGHVDQPIEWEVVGTEQGTVYRLTHRGIAGDASLAAEWHALLLQLDMYLAADQLVPAKPDHLVAAYEAALAG
ncbi:MAG TPA: SRPBCC family protein [Microthrixaceae bacterium]|nr:SRPBCC family protein [Microthrixaceae bacterium]